MGWIHGKKKKKNLSVLNLGFILGGFFEQFLCSVKPLSNKCPETSQASGFVSSLTDCWAGAALSFICPDPLKTIWPALTILASPTPKQGQQQWRVWVISTYFKLQNILNLYYKQQKHLSTTRWRQKELLIVERWKWGFEGVTFWNWTPGITDGCPSPSVRVVLPLSFALSHEWGFKEQKWVETWWLFAPILSPNIDLTHSAREQVNF